MAPHDPLYTATLPRFPQPYTKRLIRRAIVLWFGVRLVVLTLGILAEVPGVFGNAKIAVANTAAVAALVAIDLVMTREEILIANLGVSFTRALSLVAIIAFGLELLVIAGTNL